jgi:SAM-dependent methyltransferase
VIFGKPSGYCAAMALSKLRRDADNTAMVQTEWDENQDLDMLANSTSYFHGRDVRAEAARNRRSHKVVADTLIAPHLTPSSRVIDHGCGSGYMARPLARLARRVEVVDISPGVLACARAMYQADNISYLTPVELARRSGLVDVAYLFAVWQRHGTPVLTDALQLVARKVVSSGTLLLHISVPGDQGWRGERGRPGDQPTAQIQAAVAAAGFTNATARSLAGTMVVPDHDAIAHHHLLTARRP